jgi:hypothetical protein
MERCFAYDSECLGGEDWGALIFGVVGLSHVF